MAPKAEIVRRQAGQPRCKPREEETLTGQVETPWGQRHPITAGFLLFPLKRLVLASVTAGWLCLMASPCLQGGIQPLPHRGILLTPETLLPRGFRGPAVTTGGALFPSAACVAQPRPTALPPLSPQCFIGQACAVKKGARIGRLCDCPHGATCNSFLLRCL
uniref:Cocaine- and amphetamine-regulated transcript protein n=1 Tax=Chelonoidis abingdonii TaxID=106734 RepID=A0A8C0G785_CHEAB